MLTEDVIKLDCAFSFCPPRIHRSFSRHLRLNFNEPRSTWQQNWKCEQICVRVCVCVCGLWIRRVMKKGSCPSWWRSVRALLLLFDQSVFSFSKAVRLSTLLQTSLTGTFNSCSYKVTLTAVLLISLLCLLSLFSQNICFSIDFFFFHFIVDK